ncbi:MAG: tetratricopeptide repeat protein [Bryobacteraceae bacterium]|nr:tetratricopeptide repeat protein [Acidobacteriota bacterium]
MRLLPLAMACAILLAAQRAPIDEAWDLLAKGARVEAIRVLDRILQADADNGDAHLMLGSILAEDGKGNESIAQLNEAVRLLPQSADARNALGEALAGLGEAKSARQAFRKAVELDPKFAQARVNLGLALLQSNDYRAAGEHLDRAIQLLGDTADAAYPHYLRAKVYTEGNEVEKASAELQRAVSVRPDFAEAWSDLGQARKSLLDEAGALAAFERSVELVADDVVAQYRLGGEYLHAGKAHLAVPHLQKAFSLKPDDQSTLYSLQLALREDGQLEQAAKVKQTLVELLHKRDNAARDALTAVQLNNRGAALEKTGDLRGALQQYRAALQANPEHVGIRVNLAAALLRLGQWSEGVSELREALRRDPGNAAVKQALNDALSRAPHPK